MAKFARLTSANGSGGSQTVIETAVADSALEIATRFVPALAAQFVAVPDEAEPGSIRTGTNWAHFVREPAVVPPVPMRLQLTPTEFINSFTPAEEVAIRAFAVGKTDEAKAMAIWLRRVDDARLQTVDLSLPAQQDALDALLALSLLTEERRKSIGAGLPA